MESLIINKLGCVDKPLPFNAVIRVQIQAKVLSLRTCFNRVSARLGDSAPSAPFRPPSIKSFRTPRSSAPPLEAVHRPVTIASATSFASVWGTEDVPNFEQVAPRTTQLELILNLLLARRNGKDWSGGLERTRKSGVDHWLYRWG